MRAGTIGDLLRAAYAPVRRRAVRATDVATAWARANESESCRFMTILLQ